MPFFLTCGYDVGTLALKGGHTMKEELRTEVVRFRCTKSQKKFIKERAKKESVDMSNLMRLLVLGNGLKREA